MVSKRIKLLTMALGGVAGVALLSWAIGSRIESPADAAAKAAAPVPSPILVPVEQRVLGSSVVTRGTARFGLPQPISLPPSTLKAGAGLITILPKPNTQIQEGGVLLSTSGRPVFILQGDLPAYRDFTPGMRGADVLQLERALARLGFDPGALDGLYDSATAAAVARWYKAKNWEPFGATREQLALIHTLERDAGDAAKAALAAQAALAAATPALEAARAAAELASRKAQTELASDEGGRAINASLTRTRVEKANIAAEAELAAQIAEEAYISLDPRQPEAARIAAKAKLDLARTIAQQTRLEGKAAILAAETIATFAAGEGAKHHVAEQRGAVQYGAAQYGTVQYGSTSSAHLNEKMARLEGQRQVQAALDAIKLAQFEYNLASARARRLALELAAAQAKMGVQVPMDELVFVHALPVRVHEIKAEVGALASGTILSLTDNQLSIDGLLPLDAAPLIKPGMKVLIDEQSLSVRAAGLVHQVAATPGTRGADGYHVYFEVRVADTMPASAPASASAATSAQLAGYSVRLTIPVQSTNGAVTAVPISALSLAADGSSRVQVQDMRAQTKGALKYVLVKPGLTADGFVEVTPQNGTLVPGQLVVIGYNQTNPREKP